MSSLYWVEKPSDEQVAALLNAAWEETRKLPRVVPEKMELAPFTPKDVECRRVEGWLNSGCAALADGDTLAALVDIRYTIGEFASLGWFGTHPRYRRQGLAQRCMEKAIAPLLEKNVRLIRTEKFVDSRCESACRFLESCGFVHKDPEKSNIVMQMKLSGYKPKPVRLPEGLHLATLKPSQELQWLRVKDEVFGGTSSPDWFRNQFADRWDFDPSGFMVLMHEAEMIGIAAADVYRDEANRRRITGSQIEYVGVIPEYRGKKLGYTLMIACLNHAHRLKATPCQLITQPFRTPAIRLYESLGFRLVRENRTYEKTLVG